MSHPAELRRLAHRLLPLVDLTSLGEHDTEPQILDLCRRASTPAGTVAAVCLWPRFVPAARRALAHTGVVVATVTNFPAGAADPEAAAAETAAAIAAGAQEIDVVFPYTALRAGDAAAGAALVRACRTVCGPTVPLKVILETGQLAEPALIRQAATIAVEAGADFLKTSTGKTQPGATIAAAEILFEVIAAARARRHWVGFKASGGIRTLSDAQPYLALADRVLGESVVGPATLRIGASSLLEDILIGLGFGGADPRGGRY